jgi:hypothetical protein
MEDAGVHPTLYMFQSVLPYIWRDNSMDYVTLMQEKISMALHNLIIVCIKSVYIYISYCSGVPPPLYSFKKKVFNCSLVLIISSNMIYVQYVQLGLWR